MPQGPQSLQPLMASNFGTDANSTVWKMKQDANGAVVSNRAGSLYVYPNTPLAMSVLVDVGFTIPSRGNGAAPFTQRSIGISTLRPERERRRAPSLCK
jgi:hypothetical protein